MRLIDADAFIQMMEEKCDPESTLDPWVLSVCRGGVKMMPTVDAVPVSWIMAQVEERKGRGTAFDLSVASTLRTMGKEWKDETD